MWILYLIPDILCMLFLGISMILGAAVKNVKKKYAELNARCTMPVRATVVGYKSEKLMHSSDTRNIYMLLSYCNQIIPYAVSINPRQFPVGMQLDIVYNPNDIRECIVIGFGMDGTIKVLKLMENLFLAASLICAAIGVILLPVL